MATLGTKQWPPQGRSPAGSLYSPTTISWPGVQFRGIVWPRVQSDVATTECEARATFERLALMSDKEPRVHLRFVGSIKWPRGHLMS